MVFYWDLNMKHRVSLMGVHENYKSGLFEEGQCEWDSSSTFAQLSRF